MTWHGQVQHLITAMILLFIEISSSFNVLIGQLMSPNRSQWAPFLQNMVSYVWSGCVLCLLCIKHPVPAHVENMRETEHQKISRHPARR